MTATLAITRSVYYTMALILQVPPAENLDDDSPEEDYRNEWRRLLSLLCETTFIRRRHCVLAVLDVHMDALPFNGRDDYETFRAAIVSSRSDEEMLSVYDRADSHNF